VVIGDLALRGHLVDRTIVQVQATLRAKDRQSERSLLAAFVAEHPRILGALCDILTNVSQQRDHVVIDELPRMADFALWATAAEPILGWEHGTVVDLFDANEERAQHVVAEASVLVTHLRTFVQAHVCGTWSGTARVLLAALEGQLGEEERNALHRRGSGWPSDGTRLNNQLRRLAPTMLVYRRPAHRIHATGSRTPDYPRFRTKPQNSAPSVICAPPPAPVGRDTGYHCLSTRRRRARTSPMMCTKSLAIRVCLRSLGHSSLRQT